MKEADAGLKMTADQRLHQLIVELQPSSEEEEEDEDEDATMADVQKIDWDSESLECVCMKVSSEWF